MLKTNNKVIKPVSSLPSIGDTNSIYYNTTDGFYYGWNSVTNQFDNLSKGGDPISVYIQSSSTTKPSPAVEGDELIITSNGQATGGVVTEQWIFDGTTSTWIQRPNDKSFTVLNTAQTAPTIGAGNTTNLGTIFKDASGNTYAVDFNGNGILLSVPDIRYSKALFVDPINGLDSNTGSDNAPFKTIAKALTVADGSGFRIVLAPGVYAENPTISLANLDIVTLAGSDRGNTSIQGTVTFSHTSSSSGIQGIAMTNLVHSGAGALYVTDCQINTLLNKTSTGYIEITDTQLQGTSASTLSAGTGLIKDSLIKNMTISGASSGYTLKSNIIDADGAVTFTGGAFYNIQDNSGNIVTTAGTNMETGLIASGLSAALAKQYVTDFSNKLGMINPDTNNANVNVVSWNTTTRRLEVSALPIGGAVWYSGTNTPTATGNTATSLGVATLPANYTNTTTGVIYYIDANGVAKSIEGRVTTSLLGRTGNGSAYVNPTMVSETTTVDAFLLSDGTYAHIGQIKYPGHGLVKHAYYFGSATAPYYTVTPPTTGIVQQVFYVIDENTIDIDIEQGVNLSAPSFANLVYVNGANPNSATIFDTTNPPVTNNNTLKEDSANLYVDNTGGTWVWNGTAYVTKPVANSTEFFLNGTSSDAGSNKNNFIYRNAGIGVGTGMTALTSNSFSANLFAGYEDFAARPQHFIFRDTRFPLSDGVGMALSNGAGPGSYFPILGATPAGTTTSFLISASSRPSEDWTGSAPLMRFRAARNNGTPLTQRVPFAWQNFTNNLMVLDLAGRLEAYGGFRATGMTTAQINALASPPNGLILYNTTLNTTVFRENGVWVRHTTTPM
jgi:hypothetical protein